MYIYDVLYLQETTWPAWLTGPAGMAGCPPMYIIYHRQSWYIMWKFTHLTVTKCGLIGFLPLICLNIGQLSV